MDSFLNLASDWLLQDRVLSLLRALLVVLAGFAIARLASAALLRVAGGYLDPHQRALMRRGVYYVLLGIFLLTALHQLGFNLGVLLGAAGIVSVALGFASQTSASNLISGLFLIGERPFSVGDIITVGTTTGEVISIDLLSVKLRTFDNLFVRIPNEQMIKSEVTNLTRFPIRRVDLLLGVAYKEDLPRVRAILNEVAERNPLCLDEPAPLYIFRDFGASSLDLQFSVWARREHFLEVRNGLREQIKAQFDAAGIEIPFPHVSVYAGSETGAFPVRLESSEGSSPQAGDAAQR
jgi:small-conductance mechanosensitive channel